MQFGRVGYSSQEPMDLVHSINGILRLSTQYKVGVSDYEMYIQGVIAVCEGIVASGKSVGVGEDEEVATFFYGLGFCGLVIVADSIGVRGADVVDSVGLLPAARGQVLHYWFEEKADVLWVHDVEQRESRVYYID